MKIHHVRLVGLLLVCAIGIAARLPDPTMTDSEAHRRFAFDTVAIDETFGLPTQHVRHVHRELRHIAPWISAVGASVALGDAKGDLRSDDLCHVDTRIDRVVVHSLTGRYPSFTLPLQPGPHPADTVAPMGCLIGDFNEDGLPDLLVYYWGRPPVAFLRKAASAAPRSSAPLLNPAMFVPVDIGDPAERWFTNAVSQGDFDGDGHQDLMVGNYFCDGGRVLDSTTSEPACPHQPVMQDSMSRAFNGGTKRLLLWTSAAAGAAPAVTFRELPGMFDDKVEHGWTLAFGVQDLNGDQLPDLYIANDFGPDRLLINCSHAEQSFGRTRAQLGCRPLDGPVAFRMIEGERGWTKPASKVLGHDSFKGMGVDFGDISGHGRTDIYVSNITERWALQESQFAFVNDGRRIDANLVQRGIAPYSDESESLGLSRSGWAWDAKLADFDNDGRLEALQAVGFSRGDKGGPANAWRKSCWSVLQELATANDNLLKYPSVWFDMRDRAGAAKGCDLSGGTANPFFAIGPAGRYEDVAAIVLPSLNDPEAPSRGIAIADVEGKGRLDYVVARQFAAPLYFRNVSSAAAANAHLSLVPRFIVGTAQASNGVLVSGDDLMAAPPTMSRPAFGVTVRVTLHDGRVLEQQVDGGNGHAGRRSPEIHFGLGAAGAAAIDKVAMEWRSGSPSTLQHAEFSHVEANHRYVAYLQLDPQESAK